MMRTGRISIAGLNPDNIAYVAKAFHAVTKDKWLSLHIVHLQIVN